MEPLIPSLQREAQKNVQRRSIDDFYEEAYNATSSAGTWHRIRQQFRYWLIYLALGVANSGDATELGSMNFILANSGFKEEMLMGDLKQKGAKLASAIFLGMLIGGILTGAYGDRLGRRPTLLVGLCLNTTAGLCASVSPTIQFLVFSRFIGGIGVGSILSALPTLAAETSCPSRRGFFVTFVSSFYTVGALFTAVAALYMFGRNDVHWRIFVGACAFPCLLGAIMVYFLVPESARYLASVGKITEATKAANEIAYGMGFRGAPLEVEEVRHQYESKASLDVIKDNNCLQITQQANRNISNIYSKSMWLTTVTVQLLYFALSFGSGLNTWMNTIYTQISVGDVYMHSLYFNLSNIPGILLALYFLDRWGRKRVMTSSMILSSVSLVLFAIATEDMEIRPYGVLLYSCAYHGFLVTGWCTINVMASESFPTQIRSTGIGMCAASGRIAAMVVQYVNGSLANQPAIMIMVASVFLFVGSFIPCLIPGADMAKQHLEDEISQELPVVARKDKV